MTTVLERPQEAPIAHRRYWTVEEKAILTREFDRTKENARRIGEILGRNPASVHQQAARLGLTRQQKRTRKHEWTEEDLLILRRDLGPTEAERTHLAQRLGVTPHQLSYQAMRLGLLKATDYRKRVWTLAEEETLRNFVEKESLPKLAERLHRGIGAVTVRIKRLGCWVSAVLDSSGSERLG